MMTATLSCSRSTRAPSQDHFFRSLSLFSFLFSELATACAVVKDIFMGESSLVDIKERNTRRGESKERQRLVFPEDTSTERPAKSLHISRLTSTNGNPAPSCWRCHFASPSMATKTKAR